MAKRKTEAVEETPAEAVEDVIVPELSYTELANGCVRLRAVPTGHVRDRRTNRVYSTVVCRPEATRHFEAVA